MPYVKTGAKSPTLPETLRLKIAYRKVDDLTPYTGQDLMKRVLPVRLLNRFNLWGVTDARG